VRCRVSGLVALQGLVAAIVSIVAVGAAQTSTEWVPLHTPDGKPDLQGVWDFRTATPLERPREFADREFLSDRDASRPQPAAA
jgi:hypothetical protein